MASPSVWSIWKSADPESMHLQAVESSVIRQRHCCVVCLLPAAAAGCKHDRVQALLQVSAAVLTAGMPAASQHPIAKACTRLRLHCSADLNICTVHASLEVLGSLTTGVSGPAMSARCVMSGTRSWYSSASVIHCCSYAAPRQRLHASCELQGALRAQVRQGRPGLLAASCPAVGRGTPLLFAASVRQI